MKSDQYKTVSKDRLSECLIFEIQKNVPSSQNNCKITDMKKAFDQEKILSSALFPLIKK